MNDIDVASESDFPETESSTTPSNFLLSDNIANVVSSEEVRFPRSPRKKEILG